ncbi:MAG TPA: LapA family protein [Clostridia bacterium]|nr:LapA family protein [Clostridia bacterium]
MAVVALLLFALVVAIFAVQNAQEVPVRFFTYSFSNLPLSVVIIGSVAVGAVFIGLLWLVRHVRLVMKLREANAKVKKAEAALKEMGEVEKALRERITVLEASAAGGGVGATATAGAGATPGATAGLASPGMRTGDQSD